jgi:hypothetical protein
MSVTAVHIKIINDSKGNRLFELPLGTLLDYVVIDLWNDIARYKFLYNFILCNRVTQYRDFVQWA